MNCWNATGRFTKDPEIKTTEKNGKELKIANFTLAIPKDYGNGADFVRCVAFGSKAEVVEKYFRKGMKADITASINTNSYQDKDGKTVYSVTANISKLEFGESKSASQSYGGSPQAQPKDEPVPNSDDGFMQVSADDEGLPFNL